MEHAKINLKPLNAGFEVIELSGVPERQVRLIAEFVAALEGSQ